MKKEIKDLFEAVQGKLLEINPNSTYTNYSREELDYFENILIELYSYLKKNKNIKNVLDIGCSYGSLLLFVRELNTKANLVGIDFREQYINKQVFENNNIVFKNLNIEMQDLDDTKYDIILMTDILSTFNFNPIITFNKIVKSLTDTGKIFLSTLAGEHTTLHKLGVNWRDLPEINQEHIMQDSHMYFWNKYELLELFTLVGLQVDFDKQTEPSNGLYHHNLILSKIK